MLIKKVRLHNIRSYVDAEISFSEGKTLIAGDIGSGKSTILLAVEFALFGFIKGDISGSMLLRHGWNEGFVELTFIITNQEIIIRRTLKRTSISIVQDSGFIVKNNVKENLTATELKAKILELLGYPEDLMTKSKSLIYRYTIYTPQEDMKSILFGDVEERLNIIRRIFGIDKYKRVKENCSVYAKSLREELRELAGRTFDLEDKKSRLKLLEAEFFSAQKDVVNIEPLLVKSISATENCRHLLNDCEQKRVLLLDAKKQQDFCVVSLQQLQGENMRLESEQKQTTERISGLNAELDLNSVEDLSSIKQLIADKKSELFVLDKERTSLISKNANSAALEKISSALVEKIKSINTCPLCLQKVSGEHKHSIMSAENSKILAAQQECEKSVFLQVEIDKKIVLIKSEIESLIVKEKSAELLQVKQQHIIECGKRLSLINDRIAQIMAESKQLLEKKSLCEQNIGVFGFAEQEYLKSKS
ncbi:SMC family ATPase, partial [Candidatus Woesearchaeota archaeon]|nr:SMC family ATPase [Candidatus Woesearchaeota archaeon]